MRRIFVFLVLLVLLPARALCEESLAARVDPSWSPYYRLPSGDNTGLIEESRKLIHTNPIRVVEALENAKILSPYVQKIARGLIADALYQAGGNYVVKAEKAYKAILADAPSGEELAWVNFMNGNILKAYTRSHEARFYYKAALDGNEYPFSSAALFDMGATDLENQSYSFAKENLENWLKKYNGKPGTALVLALLAEACAETGEKERAVKALELSIEVDPDAWVSRPHIGYSLAKAFERDGKAEEGTRILERIAEKREGTESAGKARLTAGDIWVKSGRVDLAVRSFAKLVEENPGKDDEEEARLRLALLGVEYNDSIELTEPLAAYRDFYRPEPRFEAVLAGKNPERKQRALYGLAALKEKEGDTLDSLKRYVEVFDKYPETPVSNQAFQKFIQVLGDYMQSKLTGGDSRETVRIYETYKEKTRWVEEYDRGLILVLAADAYKALGSKEMAEELYQAAYLSGSSAVSIERIRSNILATKIDKNDAEAMQEWLKENPEDGEVWLKLARNYRQLQKATEAREAYKSAEKFTRDAKKKLEISRESASLTLATSTVDEQLAGATERRKLANLSGSEDVDDAALVEARLRFAKKEYAEVVFLLEKQKNLSSDDLYILGMSFRNTGVNSKARDIFSKLANAPGNDTYKELAAYQVKAIDREMKK